jgi:hypothetical protein
MSAILTPFSLVIACIGGWLNQHQQRTIDYLVEENPVLREQIGDRRVRFTDDQRRRLAVRAKEVGRSALSGISTIVTPETLLAWHRRLIAIKYDGSDRRKPGRPRIQSQVEALIVAWLKRTVLGATTESKVRCRTSATKFPQRQ